jgi:hypothetical protein
MERTEIKNAIIKSAKITMEDHNVLTAWVDLDYGNSCQKFGGYTLYLDKGFKHHETKSFCGHFIARLMDISGVKRFEEIAGKSIRVKASREGIDAIGHIIKDDWFYPSIDFSGRED